MKSIRSEYFVWMTNKIFHDEILRNAYSELMSILDAIIFEWSLEMDENRQKDGQDLRYLFGDENGYSEAQICQELDTIPPSLLEVIVALINRVQDSILYDPDKPDRNQEIFIDILKSLGIEDCIGALSEDAVTYITDAIYRFYNRDYTYFGEGGLFTVSNPKNDMRDTEIWFQFMWYLDEKRGGKYL